MAENKYRFERLTLKDDVNLDVYEDAINFVFDNPDVKNVAITGAYSAGKSSVLASYKNKHNNLKFLHISLAHFKSPEQDNETDVKESVLEGKILNQLIHQIPSSKIPQTNFRVKRKVSTISVVKQMLEFVLLFVAVIYYARFDVWKNYVYTLPDNWFKSVLSLSTHQYALMVDGLLIICLLSFILYGLIKIQKNKNVFRKLNLQGNEIELFAESNDSFFDKYLNEVLYLFENAEADVIVFEDLDRFNANIIFERLREINTLANIQLQKETENKNENKKVLRFFYLLRDDIFTSKDRTKFFDYIIPVVPVIDSSNSYDQFISKFKEGGLFEKFDESFLQGLSLYIDDMRLLKNIYNEFVIYYNRLNTTELVCNKMLAIIAYKNLFPRDFANLQLNQGFVYTLFSKKDQFIESKRFEIEKSIEERKKLISSAERKHPHSIEELNIIFAQKYLSNYSWHSYDGNRLQNFLLQQLQSNHLSEYSARKQELETLLSLDITQLKDEVSSLEQELLSVNNQQLCQIITRDNIDTIFSITSTNEIGKITDFNEIKGSEYFDLLKYLIRNGYIDETYADYMTYFYENSLSRIDKIFLRSITDKRAKEYTYRLKNPKLVVSRLRSVDFDQEEALNFDLLTYLLHFLSNPEYIERFIDQLKNTKNFKFVGLYFDITTELPSYIKYLNIRWPEMFLTALSENSLSKQQIRRYSICSIYYSDDSIIELVNKDNCLRDYISNTRDYLAIEKPNINRLIHCFTLLGVRFVGFDYAELDKTLFRAVYEISLYEINVENLKLIQRKILGAKNEDILYKNYTLLYSNPDSAITQYVNQNINLYFDVILKMGDGRIYDDEKVVIAVLNNPDLTIEHKHSYISALQRIITSIKEITDYSLWSSLLNADLVQYSEQNIMDCFNAIQLNESVIAYINRFDSDIDLSKVEYDDRIKEKLFDSAIICVTLENSKYEQILASLNYYYDDFDITDIPNDKIGILINTNIIRMTGDTLAFMRENYPNQILCFIRKNIEKYVDIMEDDLFSQDELLEVLKWDIRDELKIKLLAFSNEEISIVRKNYSPAVCSYILNNNFMRSDLTDLFSSFEDWDDSIQEKIFIYAVQNITRIIIDPEPVSEKLKNDLIRSDKLNRNEKIDLFIAMIPHLDEDSLKETLTLLELTEFLKIFDAHKRPKFAINEENEKLLSAFKGNNLIADYEVSEKEGYYKVIRVKQAIIRCPR